MLHDRKWSNDAWNRWWHDEYGGKWALNSGGEIGKWAIVGVFIIEKGIFVCQTLKSSQVSNGAPKALIGNNNRWTLNLKVSGKNSFARNGNLNNLFHNLRYRNWSKKARKSYSSCVTEYYNGDRIFLWVNAAEAWCWPPSSFYCRVAKGWELYRRPPSVLAWEYYRVTFTFNLIYFNSWFLGVLKPYLHDTILIELK